MKADKIMPLVSVFVASYNNAKFIRQSLDSVLGQTYQAIELIIIDDSSTDNSVQVIEGWLKETNYPAKFIQNERNLGICKTSNVFLANAKGIYTSWLASDDIMRPQKLEIQVALLEACGPNVGVVYSDAFVINSLGKRYFSRFIQMHRQFMDIPQGDIFSVLLSGNYIPIMSTLFRRNCFEDCGWYDEKLAYEDHDILLRLSKKYAFVFSEYISAEYRIHGNNMHLKMPSLRILESDFLMYYKHLGYSVETDNFLKIKLFNLVVTLRDTGSKKTREYVVMLNQYFSLRKPALFVLNFGIKPHHYDRVKSVFKFLPELL